MKNPKSKTTRKDPNHWHHVASSSGKKSQHYGYKYYSSAAGKKNAEFRPHHAKHQEDTRVVPTLDRVMYQEKAFSEEECEKILSYRTEWMRKDGKIQKSDNTVNLGKDQNFVDDFEYRQTTLYIPQEQESVEWIMKKILNIVNAANSMKDAWNFDIRGIIEIPNIMEYTEGSFHESGIDGHYGFHIDIGPGRVPSMRKIAYSVILNDDYDGGKLNIKLGRQDHYPPQKKGGIIMFPSYMLHCVEPVTKGTRCAVVGWIHGPSFL